MPTNIVERFVIELFSEGDLVKFVGDSLPDVDDRGVVLEDYPSVDSGFPSLLVCVYYIKHGVKWTPHVLLEKLI